MASSTTSTEKLYLPEVEANVSAVNPLYKSWAIATAQGKTPWFENPTVQGLSAQEQQANALIGQYGNNVSPMYSGGAQMLYNTAANPIIDQSYLNGMVAQGTTGLANQYKVDPTKIDVSKFTFDPSKYAQNPADIQATAQSYLGDFAKNRDAYMDPFLQAQRDEINRQADVNRQGIKARQASSRAFGNTRGAIQESNLDDNTQRQIEELGSKAFTQAQGAFQNDAARNLQAQGMNQNIDMQVAQLNAQTALQGNSQNAQNALQANAQNNQSQLAAANLNSALARGDREAAMQAYQQANDLALRQAGMKGTLLSQMSPLLSGQSSVDAQKISMLGGAGQTQRQITQNQLQEQNQMAQNKAEYPGKIYQGFLQTMAQEAGTPGGSTSTTQTGSPGFASYIPAALGGMSLIKDFGGVGNMLNALKFWNQGGHVQKYADGGYVQKLAGGGPPKVDEPVPNEVARDYSIREWNDLSPMQRNLIMLDVKAKRQFPYPESGKDIEPPPTPIGPDSSQIMQSLGGKWEDSEQPNFPGVPPQSKIYPPKTGAPAIDPNQPEFPRSPKAIPPFTPPTNEYISPGDVPPGIGGLPSAKSSTAGGPGGKAGDVGSAPGSGSPSQKYDLGQILKAMGGGSGMPSVPASRPAPTPDLPQAPKLADIPTDNPLKGMYKTPEYNAPEKPKTSLTELLFAMSAGMLQSGDKRFGPSLGAGLTTALANKQAQDQKNREDYRLAAQLAQEGYQRARGNMMDEYQMAAGDRDYGLSSIKAQNEKALAEYNAAWKAPEYGLNKERNDISWYTAKTHAASVGQNSPMARYAAMFQVANGIQDPVKRQEYIENVYKNISGAQDYRWAGAEAKEAANDKDLAREILRMGPMATPEQKQWLEIYMANKGGVNMPSGVRPYPGPGKP